MKCETVQVDPGEGGSDMDEEQREKRLGEHQTGEDKRRTGKESSPAREERKGEDADKNNPEPGIAS